jgi:CHASE2 domain-containing sensor protein
VLRLPRPLVRLARDPRAPWNRGRHHRRFWKGILVGIAIEVLLHAAEGTPPVVSARNWALDYAMRIKTDLASHADPAVPRLAFVDVDEETWSDPEYWGGGEPYRAPRDRLWQLIEFALDHNARFVVVDVIVESKNDCEDRDFAADVADLIQRPEHRDKHLLFVRTLREPPPSRKDLAPEWRSSPLDTIASPNVHAVAPYFVLSSDGIIRDWQLWRAGCRAEAGTDTRRWQVLPSVQIAVAALSRGGDGQARLPPELASRCAVDPSVPPRGDVLAPGQVEESINDELWRSFTKASVLRGEGPSRHREHEAIDLGNRIFFTVPFPPRPDQALHVPARDVLARNEHALSLDFGNGVAIIGQSFEGARDRYATPIGAMPGSFVILNGVRSMLAPGILRLPHWAARHALTAFTMVVVSLIFAFLDSWLATLVVLVSLVPGLISLNYLLSDKGYWVDFAAPMLGIGADRVWDVIKDGLAERWRRFKGREAEPEHRE